jgi:hypothetical protein
VVQTRKTTREARTTKIAQQGRRYVEETKGCAEHSIVEKTEIMGSRSARRAIDHRPGDRVHQVQILSLNTTG